MSTANTQDAPADALVKGLLEFIERSVVRNGGDTAAINPGHRVKFHWPPHPVSYEYRIVPSDWSGETTFEHNGETFAVVVARTARGVFGRCDELWLDARGDSLAEMLENLSATAEPLFQHQRKINDALERTGRFTGHIRDLEPLDLLKLLYCEDRDVARDAQVEIETHASSHLFLPALVAVLEDRRHRLRRSAQWSALDLFEDLPSYANGPEEEALAIAAIKSVIWDATDDFARTTFKAGVVLGGHLPDRLGGPTLLACLESPSRIGRRSAIHGLFHVVEWVPTMREQVVRELRTHAKRENDLQLQEFTVLMARDIEAGDVDHIPEPIFDGEL